VNGTYNSTQNYSADQTLAECYDEIGTPHLPHNLTVKDLDATGLVPITGVSTAAPYSGSYYTSSCYGNLITTCNSHLAITLPSSGQETTKLMARTNPGRPVVTPLTLLQDLVDIPKALHDAGKVLSGALKSGGGSLLNPKVVANQHLATQFGWLPLVQDVKDLLSLQQHIDRRVGELHRLYNVGGLKRRLELGRYTNSSENASHLATSYAGGYVQGKLDRYTECHRWGTVRWLPSKLPKHHPGDRELIIAARKLVLGISTEGTLEGLWDVIPWTWIIDWFANIGEFAIANSNTVPAVTYQTCIMTHTRTLSRFHPTFRSNGIQGGDGLIIYETKERTHDAIPTPSTTLLPLLGVRRLSILSALSIQKLLK